MEKAKKIEQIYTSLKAGKKTYKYSQLRSELKAVGYTTIGILDLTLKSNRARLLEIAEEYLYDEQPNEDLEGLEFDSTRDRALRLGFTWRESAPTAIRYRYLLINKEVGCVGFDDLGAVQLYLDNYEIKLEYLTEDFEGE